jgi:hypothetical protein
VGSSGSGSSSVLSVRSLLLLLCAADVAHRRLPSQGSVVGGDEGVVVGIGVVVWRLRRLLLLHAADVADIGLRGFGQGTVGENRGVVGVGADWGWRCMVGSRVRRVSGLVVVVLVVRLLALLVLAVVVVGAVVVVARMRLEFHLVFVLDDGHYDGLLLEGHVRVGCGCGGRGSRLGVTGGGLRVVDCCGL